MRERPRKKKARRLEFGRCGGKRRYRDKREAERSMHGIAAGRGRARLKDADPCRAYECPNCHGWHLTSRPS